MRRFVRVILLLSVFAVPVSCQPPDDEACLRVGQTAVCYPS